MPDTATLATIQQLGTTGFAILVLWWMYKHSADRIDKKEDSFRALEREIRDKILQQLTDNTQAFKQVMEHFSKHH